MSLDIGSGSSRPYVKYNAKAGRFYIRGESDDVEIQPPTCIIDFDNIVSGYFFFREGQAPDRALDPAMGTRAQQPTPDHKRGFIVMCYSEQFFGGAVEMSSSAERVFLQLLDALTHEGRHVNDAARGSIFAPAIFAKRPEREGLKRGDFSAAMERLFASGTIKVETFKDHHRNSCRRIVRSAE